MGILASSYLFHAQPFVSADVETRLQDALTTARACEESGTPYPVEVLRMVDIAYARLEIDAPEVASDFGPPRL